MDIGRVFSDAWRYTFREKAQWGFTAVIGAMYAVLSVGFFAAMVAIVEGVYRGMGLSIFDPMGSAELPTYTEDFFARSIGAAFAVLALWLIWGVATTYVRAIMEGGLTYSAGALAHGHRPTFGETMGQGFRSSARVWGAQMLTLYLPLIVLQVVLSIVYSMFGVLAASEMGQTVNTDAQMTPTMCLGTLIITIVLFAGWMVCEAWSQLAVRHQVLWRQGVTAAIGQGTQVLRARFGYAMLVVLSLIGAFVMLMIAHIVVFGVMGSVLPEGPFVLFSWVEGLFFWAVLLTIAVYISNVWTALVLQSRPEAGFAQQPIAPPAPFPPPAPPQGYPISQPYAPTAPPQGYPIAQPPAAPPAPPQGYPIAEPYAPPAPPQGYPIAEPYAPPAPAAPPPPPQPPAPEAPLAPPPPPPPDDAGV